MIGFLFCRIVWVFLFTGGVGYGYLLYTPVLHDWFYNRAIHDVEKTDFYVRDLPFPAITICSNNQIVKRQLESVLLTQPWKGYNKRIENFDKDFESALTSLVLTRENPKALSYLSQGTIDILNEHKDVLPDVMKKVQDDIVPDHMLILLINSSPSLFAMSRSKKTSP